MPGGHRRAPPTPRSKSLSSRTSNVGPCLRAHPVVAQVLKTYSGRIRFVYRNFPLSSHPNARPAAEAAACAGEQGKFWPYHDWLFDHQDKLGDADLKQTRSPWGSTPRSSTRASMRTNIRKTSTPTWPPAPTLVSPGRRRSSSTADPLTARSHTKRSRASSTKSWRASRRAAYAVKRETTTTTADAARHAAAMIYVVAPLARARRDRAMWRRDSGRRSRRGVRSCKCPARASRRPRPAA